MKRVMLSCLFTVALAGCEIRFCDPEPPGWEDPVTVVAVLDSLFGNLANLIEQTK